jgi:hypothetical protein
MIAREGCREVTAHSIGLQYAARHGEVPQVADQAALIGRAGVSG